MDGGMNERTDEWTMRITNGIMIGHKVKDTSKIGGTKGHAMPNQRYGLSTNPISPCIPENVSPSYA